MGVTRVGLISAMVVSVLSQSACSFLFVQGPPANHAEDPAFDCTTSRGWPVFDVIWAGLNGLGAASAAGEDASTTTQPEDGPSRDQVVLIGLGWLVVSGISAIYGFNKTAECSTAKRQRDAHYVLPAQPAPVQAASQECLDERRRALRAALRVEDQAEQIRLIKAAPVCTPPIAPPARGSAAAPATPPAAMPPAAPGSTPSATPGSPPAAAPGSTPAAAPAPSAPPASGAPAAAPAPSAPARTKTSRSSPRVRSPLPLDVSPARSRSLAMRPLWTD